MILDLVRRSLGHLAIVVGAQFSDLPDVFSRSAPEAIKM